MQAAASEVLLDIDDNARRMIEIDPADGRWTAFEIKLGERRVADGTESPNRPAKRIWPM